jgi:PAS domain S-box-containing protein
MRRHALALSATLLIALFCVDTGVLTQSIVVVLLTSGAAVYAALGLRRVPARRRPFAIAMTVALSLWALAWALWQGAILLHGTPPPPESVVNVFFLAGSLALFVALVLELAQGEQSAVAILDVATIAASLFVVVWTVLLERYAGAALPLLGRATQIDYAVTDMLLVAASLRLLITPVCRTREGLLLVGAALASVWSDLVWNWATLANSYTPGRWGDIGWLVWAVLGAAAVRTTSPVGTARRTRSGHARLLLLAAAALVSPAVFLVESGSARAAAEGPLVIGGASIALLVIGVLALLLRDSRALHERAAEIAALVDASEDAVIGTTPGGTITSWNRGAELIYGWTAAETIGQPIVMVVPPAERHAVNDSVRALSLGATTVIRHRAHGLHRDGRVLDVALTVCPVFAEGRLVAVSTVARDISAAVRAEAERERLLQELADQNDRLREVDRLKDEFVASVSHELRTPLTSIRGYLELLRDDITLDPEHDGMLDIVDRNAERLHALVSDLLFAAQVAAGKEVALELAAVDLGEVVTESLRGAGPRAEAGGVTLELDAGPCTLRADAMRLAQVADNLVSNAIKFTPPGGTVRVTVAEQDGRAVLSVADTGMGIPAEEQGALFSRFFRSRAATAGAIQGTGLGLAIVKSIVEAHGGSISVTSDVGVGTTFAVTFPLVPAAALVA